MREPGIQRKLRLAGLAPLAMATADEAGPRKRKRRCTAHRSQYDTAKSPMELALVELRKPCSLHPGPPRACESGMRPATPVKRSRAGSQPPLYEHICS